MKSLTNLYELTRAYTLPMSIASLSVIYSYAHYSLHFSFFDFIILSVGVCFIHLATNLFDDYIDIKSKLKEGKALSKMTFSTNRKAKLIKEGVFSIADVEKILIFLYFTGFLTGVYFTFTSGCLTVLFALTGLILTLLYPKSSKYYLAEAITGFIFGPLVITAGYFVLTKEFNSNLLLLSFAIFLTTIVLLHAHNIMDWEYDVKEKRKTLALLCKTKENALKAQKWMMIASYSIIVGGIINLNFNPHTTYVFLTLPIATKLQSSMEDYINIKDVKFIPKWYYGFFENWEKIKENKLDFFMYRFYLARNFALFFAIFASIGAVT